MDSKQVSFIIRQRAKEKREREAHRAFRADATRDWVPFPEYLKFAKGVDNWRKLGSYKLNEYYMDYELECLIAGMEYEHPKLYGVKMSLMK